MKCNPLLISLSKLRSSDERDTKPPNRGNAHMVWEGVGRDIVSVCVCVCMFIAGPRKCRIRAESVNWSSPPRSQPAWTLVDRKFKSQVYQLSNTRILCRFDQSKRYMDARAMQGRDQRALPQFHRRLTITIVIAMRHSHWSCDSSCMLFVSSSFWIEVYAI